MKASANVTTVQDGPQHIELRPVDFIAWERKYKRRLSEIEDGIGMEEMLFLAYSGLRRTERSLPPFDAWAETVTDFPKLEMDDDELTPTTPGASAS